MGTLRVALGGLFLASAACAAGGPAAVRLEPLQAAPPGGAPLREAAFLAGCWRGSTASDGTVIEERWTPPAGTLMLATTRFIRGDQVVDFEFSTLAAGEEGLLLTPYPRGERSPHAFRLTRGSGGRLVFEAPEHDYPKRILYETSSEGGLLARIDGGESDPEPRSWRLETVPCP